MSSTGGGRQFSQRISFDITPQMLSEIEAYINEREANSRRPAAHWYRDLFQLALNTWNAIPTTDRIRLNVQNQGGGAPAPGDLGQLPAVVANPAGQWVQNLQPNNPPVNQNQPPVRQQQQQQPEARNQQPIAENPPDLALLEQFMIRLERLELR